MDVPSKCTIVRAIGRPAYRLETKKESVVGMGQRSAQCSKHTKEKTVFHVRKASY
jgi:hypothetical protein